MPNYTHHSQEYYIQAYDKAVEMRANGALLKEIAEATGVHARTIGNWMDKGKKIHPDTVTQESLDKAYEVLKQGSSYLEASKLSGVSGHTLARKFPELGWTREEAVEAMHTSRRMKMDYDLDRYIA